MRIYDTLLLRPFPKLSLCCCVGFNKGRSNHSLRATIMRHLLTLVSLLFVGSVWADDFNFNSPRAKAAMEKYQYDKEDLLRDLETALEYERTKGSLEEAIKIRDAIATLKQQPDAPVANAQIPADAVEWNGHYYWISSDGAPWRDAKSRCESLGGHLVRITSAQEHSFVKSLIDRSQLRRSHYWTDGSDEASEGDWRFSDGQPVSYNGWKRGEPEGGRVCNHLALWNRSNWGFADDSGSAGFSYICEWDGPADGTVEANRILNKPVKFVGSLGGTRKMILSPDGRILWPNGDGHENESFWRFDNNRRLVLLNKGGDPSCVMAMIHMDDGKVRFCGPYLFGPNIYHTVEEISVPPQTPTKPERTKPKPEEPIKKLSPKHAKRVLDDANLWEGKPGVWFLKRANNFSGRTYERLSQSNRIRSALASVNGRLPTPDEINNPPSRR